MDTKSYTRQEAAQITGTPERTIRFWIYKGVMDHPEIKPDGTKRLFSAKQIDELRAVHWALKDNRLNIDAVRHLCSVIKEEAGIKYPLSELMVLFSAGAFGATIPDIKQLIPPFLSGVILFYRGEDGKLAYRHRHDIGPNIYKNYRYFEEKELEAFPDEYLQQNHFLLFKEEDFPRLLKGLYDRKQKTALSTSSNKQTYTVEDRFEIYMALMGRGVIPKPSLVCNNVKYFHSVELTLGEEWVDTWLSMKSDFETLMSIKRTIEKNIMNDFSYGLMAAQCSTIEEPPQVTRTRIGANIEAGVLRCFNNEREKQDDDFILKYLSNLVYFYPEYHGSPRMWRTVLRERELGDISFDDFKVAEKLNIFPKEVILDEANKRISKCQEEIKALRYQVIKNIKRRKK